MSNLHQRQDQERSGPLGVVGRNVPQPIVEIDASSDDGVDFEQLWGTLRDNSRFVMGVAALLFSAVMLATLLGRMSFRSSGRLYLGELESKAKAAASGSGELDLSGGGQGDVGSEIEIIKSQSLVTSAILESGLNVDIAPHGWKRPRFWQWIVAGRNPHLLDVPAQELQAVNTATVDNSSGRQKYTVTFTTDKDYQVFSTPDARLLGTGKLGRPLAVEGLTIKLVPGTMRAPVAGNIYDVTVEPLDATTDAVLSVLNVTAPKAIGTGEAAKVVTLEFENNSPYASAVFLRKLMMGYLGERQTWKTEDASAAENFVTDQLRSLRESLDKTEKRLADYRSSHRVVVLDNEAKAMIEQVGKYEEQRVNARLEVARLTDMKRVLKADNPAAEAFLFGESQDTVLEDLSQALATARNLLSEAEAQFGGAAPQTMKQRSQVVAQLDTIRGYVNNRLGRAQESLVELNKIIGQFEEKLKTVPGAELGLAQLGRESEVYSRVYSYMLERQQQAAIVKASTVSKNRILDFPQVPYREDSPKLGLRLASGPLALVLGAILVLLSRVLSTSFQSEGETRRMLGGLPLLGTLPRRIKIANSKRAPSPVPEGVPEFVYYATDHSTAYPEALRLLRTGILHMNASDRGRVILLTSPTPGDGKTTTATSLAATLAADGKRVLLVDADMRKPSHHRLIGYSRDLGLRGVLSGQYTWREALHPVPVPAGSLDSIGAGRMAPAELLSDDRMNRFLNDVRDNYDFVLLDGPSFPLVSDPLVLSKLADMVLSVFRLRHTPRKTAIEHVRRLSSAALGYAYVLNDSTTVGAVYGEKPNNVLMERVVSRFSTITQSTLFSRWLTAFSVACALSIAAAGVVLLIKGGEPSKRVNAPAVSPQASAPEPQVEPTPPAPSHADEPAFLVDPGASAADPQPDVRDVEPPATATQPAADMQAKPLPKWWELEKAGRLVAPPAAATGAATEPTSARPRAVKGEPARRSAPGWLENRGLPSAPAKGKAADPLLPANPYSD